MSNRIFHCSLYLLTWNLHHAIAYDEYLASKFHESRFVPDVIPEPPEELLNVTFSNHGYLYPGEKLFETETSEQPNVTWNADPNSLYALYMAGITNWTMIIRPQVNPAEPNITHRICHEFHQWVTINIPGNNYSGGMELYPYIAVTPPPKPYVSDRYAILIYKQPGVLNPPLPKWTEWYFFQEFSPTVKFVKDYNLTGPVAGNMFWTTD
ncbi:OV-16 antigen-like [Planococcus citri]|uniref:OV-16 antigen-like n=1 Tax=Planococcus citri TaxID=170843 RepID=UPI0031F82AA1